MLGRRKLSPCPKLWRHWGSSTQRGFSRSHHLTFGEFYPSVFLLNPCGLWVGDPVDFIGHMNNSPSRPPFTQLITKLLFIFISFRIQIKRLEIRHFANLQFEDHYRDSLPYPNTHLSRTLLKRKWAKYGQDGSTSALPRVAFIAVKETWFDPFDYKVR